MIYSVSPALYREAADRLLDAVGAGSYFSGSLSFRFEETDCRLTASVIVYRTRRSLPEGDVDAVADLVPVWWEFHTQTGERERLNDFSFSELRQLIR